MTIFTKFNQKSINDRQIDTLIGISKGIIADGEVVKSEAEFLYNWLIQSRQISDNPIIINLLKKVDLMLEDGILDNEESIEIMSLLRKISGDSSTIGELSKTTSLPLNTPAPSVIFTNKTFLFTGTCAYGSRKQCQSVIEKLGGINASSIIKKLDYLVLGTYVTDSWIHENYGRKIEKAVKYRDEGCPIFIITEEHLWEEGNIN